MSKEINLLPRRRRRQITRRFFEQALLRLLVSMLLGLLLMTAVGVITLVGITAAGTVFLPAAGDDVARAILDYRAETGAVQDQNELIAEMQQLHEQRLVWSSRLPDILHALPPGTEIAKLSGKMSERTLTFSGRASARSALIVLKDKLSALSWATSVEAPVENLLERLRPEFTFSLHL